MSVIDIPQDLKPAIKGERAGVVSVVIPCLNEAETIEGCVLEAEAAFEASGLPGEIIVVDNGSVDGSAVIAAGAGARVVHEPRRGYGRAYLAGFAAARGDVIVMADGDLTYDFREIPRFVQALDDGADFVIGHRSCIHRQAMPFLHRYVGNPLLTGLLNLMFQAGVSDAHCGLRAFQRRALTALDLRAPGMEFASEMVVRAANERLAIRELPIEYRRRGGESKLSTFRDGYRHLRFLLLHSPTYLFIVPGALAAFAGTALMIAAILGVQVLGPESQLYTVVGAAALTVGAAQVITYGVWAHAKATRTLRGRDPWFNAIRVRCRREHGLVVGAVLTLLGVTMALVAFGLMAPPVRQAQSGAISAVAAAELVVLGVQLILCAVFLPFHAVRAPAGTAKLRAAR